ncbi:MAG: hypothetical protein ACOCUI_00935 [bacterium]
MLIFEFIFVVLVIFVVVLSITLYLEHHLRYDKGFDDGYIKAAKDVDCNWGKYCNACNTSVIKIRTEDNFYFCPECNTFYFGYQTHNRENVKMVEGVKCFRERGQWFCYYRDYRIKKPRDEESFYNFCYENNLQGVGYFIEDDWRRSKKYPLRFTVSKDEQAFISKR